MKILKFLWEKWLAVARPVGNFQGQVILSFFYLVLLAPLALFLKIFADPLRLRSLRQNSGQAGQAAIRRTNFDKWEHPKQSLEGARKQY
ncbi:hypothetical protein A3B51_02065 [Candidatus Curtissbacteria bacterium RIFCSPLOWO2_01_FULL_41_18]|uniref:Uncharacterized protein n=2 Tax=Candidatus Curtissiibacteriota TaxID=1752717 RepID=A0A1F5G0Q7_9BACT|nr:MAG: hypothetical protein A2696_02430 [Candidatus Curtissbacteria bacterium RIFCSPHIGHO2_01_FULL_41_13]OGE05138.1 MAG: hypothetical protein A3B51_02065 [Candidatus Curtissbacteria bacterium RIFCSPLOWO2_01_FULL_41_18]